MKKLTDEEIMDHTYNTLFGDLDDIRSGSLFSSDKEATQGAADNAGTPGIEGVSLTIKPLMAGASETGRPPESGEEADEEEDKLKGIGKLSPLMAQLHGDR